MSETVPYDHEIWAQVLGISDNLMARIGKQVTASTSEATWRDAGVNYTLRKTSSVWRTIVAESRNSGGGGHIGSEFTLRSFNASGLPEGKLLTFTAPEGYLGRLATELSVGFGEEPPELWAWSTLTLAMRQVAEQPV